MIFISFSFKNDKFAYSKKILKLILHFPNHPLCSSGNLGSEFKIHLNYPISNEDAKKHNFVLIPSFSTDFVAVFSKCHRKMSSTSIYGCCLEATGTTKGALLYNSARSNVFVAPISLFSYILNRC